MWTTHGQEPNSSREIMDASYSGFNFKVKLLFCCIISIDIALGHIFPTITTVYSAYVGLEVMAPTPL